MTYASTPLPIGRNVCPLEYFDPEKRAEIEAAATADQRPPRWLDFGLAQITSRAWYEWHWFRGIDPDKARRKLSPWLRSLIIERDGLICGICGFEVDRDDVHIDHIVPVSLGGSDETGNLQVSHARCNLLKGARV